jgi:recombination protein RecA
VDLGVERKVMEKSGAWYSYKGERLGQGREAVRDYLEANPPIAREIEAKLRELAGVPVRGAEKRAEGKTEEKRPDDKRSHAGKGT